MRAYRIGHVKVQMNADDIVRRDAIRGIRLEFEPIDIEPISKLGPLGVQREECLAKCIRMR